MLTPCILAAAAAWWAAACGLSTYMWWLSLLLGEESLPALLGLPAQEVPAVAAHGLACPHTAACRARQDDLMAASSGHQACRAHVVKAAA